MRKERADALIWKMLGEAFRAYRTKENLTVEEFAERLDIEPRYVQFIEAGKRRPSLGLIKVFLGQRANCGECPVCACLCGHEKAARSAVAAAPALAEMTAR